MAKLTGPLLSVNARGTIAGILTFSKRSSGPQVRYQHPQKDYENAARLSQRARFWLATEWWLDLSTAERDEWNRLANEL